MDEFKRDFPGWFNKNYLDIRTECDCSACGGFINPQSFYNLPFPMKWGVYVDFFLQNGMYIYIQQGGMNAYSVYIDWCGHHILTEYMILGDLSSARECALHKAIEIYNDRKQK